jgi:hypothetical protein
MRSGSPRHLGSKNLILFRRGRHDYKIPRLEENDSDSPEQVEDNLSPEEKSFVAHYLRYADALLKQPSEEAAPYSERRQSRLVEMGGEYGHAHNGEDEEDGCARFNAA